MRFFSTLIITLLFSHICNAQNGFSTTTTDTCPVFGRSISDIGKHVNTMKNRNIVPGKVNANITIDSILKGMPEDTGMYKPDECVTITGYVLGADDAGPESCNCFSRDSSKQNIVLYVGNSVFSGKDSVFVVEITAKYKANHLTSADVLFGKKITVTGYMMYNFEMRKMALNACKKCRTTDRKTAWEICPVTDIQILSSIPDPKAKK
jgi:hypothetical protein